jgi:hypothetical protein
LLIVEEVGNAQQVDHVSRAFRGSAQCKLAQHSTMMRNIPCTNDSQLHSNTLVTTNNCNGCTPTCACINDWTSAHTKAHPAAIHTKRIVQIKPPNSNHMGYNACNIFATTAGGSPVTNFCPTQQMNPTP